ncbi:hypothetical protein C8R46DRAFT_1350671, partial [Mycena filopes]
MAAFTRMTPDQMRTRLDELDTIIQQDEARLERHRAQRLAISRRLDALVYPVLTLPPEITSMIFRSFVHSAPHTGSYRKSTAPMILRHVCTTWRDIASADSALWAALHFDFDRDYRRNTVAELAGFLQTWIGRARSRPLSVVLHGDMAFRLGSAGSVALLRRLAPTVRELELRIPRDIPGKQSEASNISWPMLERLKIDAAEKPMTGFLQSTFAAAPLRMLCLHKARISSVTVCWKQLTTFDGHMYCLNDYLELLQIAVNLSSCRLSLRSRWPVESSGDRRRATTHRSLGDLELRMPRSLGFAVPSRLLRLLTLPRLHTFAVYDPSTFEHMQDTYPPGYLGRLTDFLRRHSTRLVDLQIDHVCSVAPSFTSDFSALLENPDILFLQSLQHITWALDGRQRQRKPLQP